MVSHFWGWQVSVACSSPGQYVIMEPLQKPSLNFQSWLLRVITQSVSSPQSVDKESIFLSNTHGLSTVPLSDRGRPW